MRIDEAFRTDELVSALFELLTNKIAAGKTDRVRHSLPVDLHVLRPASSKAA